MESAIPFALNAPFVSTPGEVSLPPSPGYVLELHGLYLSVDPGTYSLASGPCELSVGSLQGLSDEETVNIDFVPSSTAAVNLHIPLRARAIGNTPITLTISTGGSQPITARLAVWGELVPLS